MTFSLYSDFLHAVGELIMVVFSFLCLKQEGLISTYAFVIFVLYLYRMSESVRDDEHTQTESVDLMCFL